MKPFLIPFSKFPIYSDPGATNQSCRDLLSRGDGEASSLQIGTCELTGPGQVAEDIHTAWTQYFLVTEGEGEVVLNGVSHAVSQDMIVEIPKGTSHYSRCAVGKTLKYFFINIHDV